MDIQIQLAEHAALLMFFWVPFAIVGGIVDTWGTAGGRLFRTDVLHPRLAWRARHPPFAAAH